MQNILLDRQVVPKPHYLFQQQSIGRPVLDGLCQTKNFGLSLSPNVTQRTESLCTVLCIITCTYTTVKEQSKIMNILYAA